MTEINAYDLLQRGKQCLEGRDIKGAEQIAMTLLRHDDKNASILNFAATVFAATHDFDKAERCFRRSIESKPDRALSYVRLADLVSKSPQRREEANQLAERALELSDNDPELLKGAGLVFSHTQNYEKAYEIFIRALEISPNDSKLNYFSATAARFLGDLEKAESLADKALQLNPEEYEGLFLRSDVRKQTRDNNHIAELEERVAKGVDKHQAKYHHYYVLAKEYEDIGEYDKSFATLSIGASIRREGMAYKVENDTGTMSLIQETYAANTIARLDGHGCDKSGPIFILGMPRTGTTLLERIVSSHDDVHAAGELNELSLIIAGITHKHVGRTDIDKKTLVRESVNVDFEKLGQAYVDACKGYAEGRAMWIDKLPVNFLYCGIIKLALPNAKIINLQRNPMDTCYSNYKMLFNAAGPYSYSLQDVGEYYAAYHKLMVHWNEVLPGFIHTVSYEDLTDNTEREAKRVLDFCGLEWDERVLDFHKNKSASTTASASQVRQPVYRSSVQKWKHFEKQLQPLRDILEGHGIEVE